jgi:putative transposase
VIVAPDTVVRWQRRRFRAYWTRLLVLAHDRRRVLHFTVSEHPTAQWTAQQIVDTFPNDTAPTSLLRDRARAFAEPFRTGLKRLGSEEVITAPQSPWQSLHHRYVRRAA